MFRCLYAVLFACTPTLANACERILVSPLALSPALPRVEVTELNAPVPGADDLGLSDASPARIITRDGADLVLAVDAGAVDRAGFDRFFTETLAMPAGPAGDAWRAEVRTRLRAFGPTAHRRSRR